MPYIEMGTVFKCEKDGYILKVSDDTYNSKENFDNRVSEARNSSDNEYLVCEVLYPIKDKFFFFYTGRNFRIFHSRESLDELLKGL